MILNFIYYYILPVRLVPLKPAFAAGLPAGTPSTRTPLPIPKACACFDSKKLIPRIDLTTFPSLISVFTLTQIE